MRPVLLGFALSLLAVGCQQPQPRLNAPPHGEAVVTSELRETFTAMADNALLADMTIADIHFVPQRAMLNSLGVQRLARLTALVDLYGGTIRYSSADTDRDLVEARLHTIREFLTDAGISNPGEVVVRDLPASRGMEATEALQLKDAAFKPKKTGTPDAAGAGGPPPNGKPQ